MVEGDDNVFASDRDVTSSIELAAKLFGFKAEYTKTNGESFQFCKVRVTDNGMGDRSSAKSLPSVMNKLGWTTKNVKAGSKREAMLTQSKLLITWMMYTDSLPGMDDFVAAMLDSFPDNRRYVKFVNGQLKPHSALNKYLIESGYRVN